jgi:hypothetical protein
MIGKLTESYVDLACRVALQAALNMVFKQRNILAYK